MNSQASWRMRCASILLITSALTSCVLTSSCSTGGLPVSVSVTDNPEVPLIENEHAPFSGVLLSYGRYEYLLKCENYVEQEGAMP
ncbi:MAG: hypothetical protein ACYSSO_15350 [Planctomycetota bacterium]